MTEPLNPWRSKAAIPLSGKIGETANSRKWTRMEKEAPRIRAVFATLRRARENHGLIQRAILPVLPASRDREGQKISFDVRSIGISVNADFTDGTDRERT